jgi:hypothetical protein
MLFSRSREKHDFDVGEQEHKEQLNMKWALFVLACVSLYVSYHLGIQQETTGGSFVLQAGWLGGAIAAGMIGTGSAIGAALADKSSRHRQP